MHYILPIGDYVVKVMRSYGENRGVQSERIKKDEFASFRDFLHGDIINPAFIFEDWYSKMQEKANHLPYIGDTPSYIGPKIRFEDVAKKYGINVHYTDGPIYDKYDGMQYGNDIWVNSNRPDAYKGAVGFHEIGHAVKGKRERDAHDFAYALANDLKRPDIVEALKQYERVI